MVEPVVQVENLTKFFKTLKAVDNLSFDIYPAEILGLVGPNGAGKTTTIHMLLGLTVPTSGRIRVFGFESEKNREKILQRSNFSSTYVSMPYSLTVRESLRVFAQLYQVKGKEEKIQSLLKLFEMVDIRDKQVRQLSSGQQTRLNLAKALINDPELLFLDEPTSSLDPDIADKTRKFLKRIKEEKNISILYTSQNMKEMEEISDRVLFIHKGRLIASGIPDEVIRRFGRRNLEEVFIKVAREQKS